jgi:hypothetical protein
VSARPVDGVRKGYEIWTAEKTADGWGEPRNLGPVVNTSQNDAFVTAAANGNLYFCSDRDGSLGSYDIYVSRLVDGQYQRPENLGPRINTAQMDTDPLISPDERFLIFSRGDFYISYNAGGEWTEPELLGGRINTPEAHEFTPGFSPTANGSTSPPKPGGTEGVPGRRARPGPEARSSGVRLQVPIGRPRPRPGPRPRGRPGSLEVVARARPSMSRISPAKKSFARMRSAWTAVDLV